MKRPQQRPIVPAPVRDPGYPRAQSVWHAFAAGVLTVAALPSTGHADCALPEHKGDPKANAVGNRTGGKIKQTKVPEHPVPMPGKVAVVAPAGEPMPVKALPPGVMAPVPALEGSPRAPDKPAPKPGKPEHKQRPPLDGDQASVGEAIMHIHPHGPDEPCFTPDDARGRLVIRFG